MTEKTSSPVDRSLENELIHNPLVRYLALAALQGGLAAEVASFYALGTPSAPNETRH
jgi:hypothetical protein